MHSHMFRAKIWIPQYFISCFFCLHKLNKTCFSHRAKHRWQHFPWSPASRETCHGWQSSWNLWRLRSQPTIELLHSSRGNFLLAMMRVFFQSKTSKQQEAIFYPAYPYFTSELYVPFHWIHSRKIASYDLSISFPAELSIYFLFVCLWVDFCDPQQQHWQIQCHFHVDCPSCWHWGCANWVINFISSTGKSVGWVSFIPPISVSRWLGQSPYSGITREQPSSLS